MDFDAVLDGSGEYIGRFALIAQESWNQSGNTMNVEK